MSIDENTKLILMRVVIAAAGVLFFFGFGGGNYALAKWRKWRVVPHSKIGWTHAELTVHTTTMLQSYKDMEATCEGQRAEIERLRSALDALVKSVTILNVQGPANE